MHTTSIFNIKDKARWGELVGLNFPPSQWWLMLVFSQKLACPSMTNTSTTWKHLRQPCSCKIWLEGLFLCKVRKIQTFSRKRITWSTFLCQTVDDSKKDGIKFIFTSLQRSLQVYQVHLHGIKNCFAMPEFEPRWHSCLQEQVFEKIHWIYFSEEPALENEREKWRHQWTFVPSHLPSLLKDNAMVHAHWHGCVSRWSWWKRKTIYRRFPCFQKLPHVHSFGENQTKNKTWRSHRSGGTGHGWLFEELQTQK